MGFKKWYVGNVVKDGISEFVFKGMEIVRSDWIELVY